MGIPRLKDEKKALEALLYVAQQVSDMYSALKLLYFADKAHLARYGRLIYQDTYIAMVHGPVPSLAYDFVKFVRKEDSHRTMAIPVHEAFRMEGDTIIPLRPPRLEFLSASEVECLAKVLAEYGNLPFPEIWEKSKDDAWFRTAENKPISLRKIVLTLPNSQLLLDYLFSA